MISRIARAVRHHRTRAAIALDGRKVERRHKRMRDTDAKCLCGPIAMLMRSGPWVSRSFSIAFTRPVFG